MENRNQYNSPRDRIDDALLIRLLNEEEPMPEYTCTGERRSGGCSGTNGTGRRMRNDTREHHSACGNSRNRPCGCGETEERRNTCMEERRNTCGESCARINGLTGYPLAMVYMPDHDWDGLFDEEEALEHGTLFRPLELPFYPGKCRCGCK